MGKKTLKIIPKSFFFFCEAPPKKNVSAKPGIEGASVLQTEELRLCLDEFQSTAKSQEDWPLVFVGIRVHEDGEVRQVLPEIAGKNFAVLGSY